MNNKLASTLVMAAVVVILTGSLLMPVLSDAREAASESETNTLINTLSQIEGEDVAQYSGAVPASGFCPLYFSDNFILRNDLVLIIFDSELHVTTCSNVAITHAEDGSITISATINSNTVNYSVDSTYAFKADPAGKFTGAQITTDTPIWINSVDEIYAGGFINTDYASAHGSTGFLNGTEAEVNYATTEVDGLLKLTASASTGVVVSDGSTDVLCKYVVVPHVITSNADAGIVALYGALPALIIAALILGVITIVVPRRD